MIITGISELDKKRKRIFIDDEYAFPLYNSEISRYHLAVDEEISQDILDSISDIIIKRIRERILYLIGDMDRTEANIRSKLLSSGYTVQYIDPAIEYLKELSYIDDYRYACAYVESMINNRSKSRLMIERGLYEKGVPRDIIEQVISETEFDDDEMIENALRNKGYDKERLRDADVNTRRKLYNYLLRNGFRSSSISAYFHDEF